MRRIVAARVGGLIPEPPLSREAKVAICLGKWPAVPGQDEQVLASAVQRVDSAIMQDVLAMFRCRSRPT